MAYGNYFPTTYQPIGYTNQPMMGQSMMQTPSMPSPPPVQMPQPQMQSQASAPINNSIQWVQGEAGAKSYLVAPGTTVQLWDSEAPVIYLKSADASGMPSMKIIDYTIRNGNTSTATPMLETHDYNSYANNNSMDGNVIDGTISKSVNIDDYATKIDVENIKEQIASIKESIDHMNKNDNNNKQNNMNNKNR